MKNRATYQPVCITPQDYATNVLTSVVRIINDFKEKGYDTREGFVNVCLEHISGLSYFENVGPLEIIKTLQNFWQVRVKDEKLNTALDNILEQLESE